MAATSREKVAAESGLADEDSAMDLAERVQKELTSEEKCIKISFSSYFIVNLVFASTASAAWDCSAKEIALVF